MKYLQMAKTIYTANTINNYRRIFVFIIRSLANHENMNELVRFFRANSLRCDIASYCPFVFEQATRHWFYRDSTFKERVDIIKEQYIFLEAHLNETVLRDIYLGDGVNLWTQKYQDKLLSMKMKFSERHKKEGLLAFVLELDSKMIYQVVAWIGRDSWNEQVLWIGALQGSVGGLFINREITKLFFGYRPQHLILQAVRGIARYFHFTRMYAVNNYGFYANNRRRGNGKLKVSLNEIWEEAGGILSRDARFYELPLIEPRKNIADVQSHKRNLYRKRFQKLDEIDEEIKYTLVKLLSKKE